MNVDEMFESKYLKKEDLKNGPITPSITNITMQMMKDRSGKDERKRVLHLQGLKPMILNVVNTKMLASLFGKETDAWIGKSIEIYVKPDVEINGEVVGGLRLRPPTTPSRNGHAPLGTSEMNMPMALQALASVNLTKDDLKRVLSSKGFTGYLPSRDTATVQAMIAEAQQNMGQEQSFDDQDQSTEIPF